MVLNKKTNLQLMHSEYGFDPGHTCGTCCNFHSHPYLPDEHCCIGFGVKEGVSCAWLERGLACGLYNKPFLAQRPRRAPLVEVYAPKKRMKEEADDEAQIGFIDI